jgi:precorrin-6x reductase
MLVAAVTTHLTERWGKQPLAEYEAMPAHQRWIMRKVPRTAVDEEVVGHPGGSNGFDLR